MDLEVYVGVVGYFVGFTWSSCTYVCFVHCDMVMVQVCKWVGRVNNYSNNGNNDNNNDCLLKKLITAIHCTYKAELQSYLQS